MATNTRHASVSIARDYMIVWTSLGQDGSREGVFGQFVHENGTPVGGEFQVNTTTINRQMQPVVTSDGAEPVFGGLDELYRPAE